MRRSKPSPKPPWGAGAIATRVEIPVVGAGLHAAGLNLGHELVVVLLTHASADNLANLREQNVGALNSLAVLINLHVERLYGLRISGHDDRLLEVLFTR